MVLFGVLKLAIDGEMKHSKAASQRGGLGRTEEGDIIHDLNPPVFPSSPVSRPPKATPGLQSSGLPAGVWLLGELSRAWLSRAPGSLSAFFFALCIFSWIQINEVPGLLLSQQIFQTHATSPEQPAKLRVSTGQWQCPDAQGPCL